MSRRAGLISAIAFALVTRVMAAPLIDFNNLSDASYPGDARLLIWTLDWDAHALLTGSPLFDANMFFPQAGALGWAEHHIGIGLFAAPVYAFCFFRMNHAHGHVQMLWTWALPLSLVAADRCVDRPTAWRTATVTALVVRQALSGWYLAVDVAIVLLVATPFLLAGRSRRGTPAPVPSPSRSRSPWCCGSRAPIRTSPATVSRR